MEFLEINEIRFVAQRHPETGTLVPLCTEPTLSLLLQKISEGEYRLIEADSEEIPSLPDWQAWQASLFADSEAIAAFESLPKIVVSALSTLVGQVADKPESVATIRLLWEQVAPGIPAGVRERLKKTASANNLPISFVEAI